MRLAAAFGVVALCLVGAALAQTDLVPAEPFAAEYDRQAEGRDYARLYPRLAMSAGNPGLAVLCCRPTADRTLECVHAIEWPANEGFGPASQAIGREFRLSPESYEAFNATPNAWIRRTIVWRMAGHNNAEQEEVLRVIREEGDNLCRPDPIYSTEQ